MLYIVIETRTSVIIEIDSIAYLGICAIIDLVDSLEEYSTVTPLKILIKKSFNLYNSNSFFKFSPATACAIFNEDILFVPFPVLEIISLVIMWYK